MNKLVVVEIGFFFLEVVRLVALMQFGGLL